MDFSCERVCESIKYYDNVFLNHIIDFEKTYQNLNNQARLFLKIGCKCTSVQAIFVVEPGMTQKVDQSELLLDPFGIEGDEHWKGKITLMWLLKNSDQISKFDCLSSLNNQYQRFTLNSLNDINFRVCSKTVSLQLFDLNKNLIKHFSIQPFVDPLSAIKSLMKIVPTPILLHTRSNVVTFLRFYLNKLKTNRCKTANKIKTNILKWFDSIKLPSGIPLDWLPSDTICPISFEPFGESDSVIEILIADNNNRVLHLDQKTLEVSVQNVRQFSFNKPSIYYKRSDLLHHFHSFYEPYTNWVAYDIDKGIDESGKGGYPGLNEFYLKLPHNIFILIPSKIEIDPECLLLYSHFLKFHLYPIKKNQRLGGIFSNSLTVGDEHGAAPGHTIYLLFPPQIHDDLVKKKEISSSFSSDFTKSNKMMEQNTIIKE